MSCWRKCTCWGAISIAPTTMQRPYLAEDSHEVAPSENRALGSTATDGDAMTPTYRVERLHPELIQVVESARGEYLMMKRMTEAGQIPQLAW